MRAYGKADEIIPHFYSSFFTFFGEFAVVHRSLPCYDIVIKTDETAV